MEWPSYSARAFGPGEIQDTGELVENWLPPGPLYLLLAPHSTCSTRPMRGDCQDWTQVGVEDGAVTGPE